MYDALLTFSFGVMSINFQDALSGVFNVSCSEERVRNG